MAFTALKSGVSRAVFLLDALGENLFLWLPAAFLGSWPLPPSSKPAASSDLSDSDPPAASYRDPCDYIGLPG